MFDKFGRGIDRALPMGDLANATRSSSSHRRSSASDSCSSSVFRSPVSTWRRIGVCLLVPSRLCFLSASWSSAQPLAQQKMEGSFDHMQSLPSSMSAPVAASHASGVACPWSDCLRGRPASTSTCQ